MKNRVLVFMLWLSLISSFAWAQPQNIKLLQGGDSWVILECEVPPFTSKEIQNENAIYQLVDIPGWGRRQIPGQPQVPVAGRLVGVSRPTEVKVEILEADSSVWSNYDLYPAPKLIPKTDRDTKSLVEEFCRDEAIYGSDSFYPGHAVEVAETGFLRKQPVARILFYPVQFNPVTHKLEFYRRIRAKVSWPTVASYGTRNMRNIEGKDLYKGVLKEAIINYETLPSAPESKKASVFMSPIESAPNPGYKMSIKENGLYRVTRRQLEAAGGNLSLVDPRTIKIIHMGQEIPIFVYGEGDGVFDPDDYVEFYAQAINTKYTNTNIYWLTYGANSGLRLSEADGGITGAAPVPAKFRTTLHLEEDHTYWGELPGGADKDLWFWVRLVYPSNQYYNSYCQTSFKLDGVVSGDTANITVTLQGRTDTSTYPDHHTRIYLNGIQIDDQRWDGQIEFRHQISVPQSLLINGSNTLKVQSVGDTGSSLDEIYLNWIEIEYARQYITKSDILEFTGQPGGRYQYEITGFGNNGIDLYDITAPHGIIRLVNTAITQDGSGYKLIFQQDEGSSPRKYLALTPSQRKFPKRIVLDKPSDLSNPANGADYIIITYDDFYDSLQPLANFRSQQGLRVVTAKLSDVYDEFNYGLSEPQAIKNFLKYAYQNWAGPPPSYVLLVGDATYDYKDNYAFGKPNYMPTYFLEASGMIQAPSDNWYVCVAGEDSLPDMYLGRISVRTAADASAVVNKIINYEQNPPTGNWNKNMLVASDNEADFEAVSNHVIELLPSNYLAHKVYLSAYSSPSQATADMKSYINSGSLITNYTGHGNKTLWAGERLFQLSDIDSLNNSNRLTWVISFTCLDGYFTHPLENYCMAEEFVRVNNMGALAAFSNTAYGYPSEDYWLAESVYRTVFEGKQRILGPASTIAKITAYSQYGIPIDYVDTYTLFGDPASILKVVNQLPVAEAQEVTTAEDTPVKIALTATDSDGDSLVYNIVAGPIHGSLSGIPPNVTYTPASGFYGKDSFTFKANDGLANSNIATVNISVYCLPKTYYRDADGDGYGNSQIFTQACSSPAGYVSDNTDCDDTDAAIYPKIWYKDTDGDGYGNSQIYTWACSSIPPTGYVGNNLDCNDTNPNINPATVWYKDANGDGYSDGTKIVQCSQPGPAYYLSSQLIASSGDYCDNISLGSDPRSNITIYVNAANTGSEDGSQANPYHTIQQAINAASCGDTIVVNSGVYTENIHFLHKSLRVMGSGADTIIDGYGRGPAVAFDSGENRYTILDGFSIRNGTGLDIGDGFTVGGGIWVSHGSSPLIVNNIIYSNRATYGGGIFCAGSSLIIMNNTIADNLATSGGGIFAVNDSSPQVTNTIIWGNANESIFLYSSAITVTYSDIESGWIGSGNIDSDPLFKDTANRNYYLQSGSPCIDTGIATVTSPANDINGMVRPQGANYDMGAYEYSNTAPVVTVNAPNGGETWYGKRNVLWMAADADQIGAGALSASLYYGHSVTGSWTQIASGIACTSGIQASYVWDTTPIASGVYYVRVVVSDGIGGSGEDISDASFRITRDHNPPAAPVITSPTHPSQTTWYNNNAPTFNWTASDESGINGYSYILNTTATTTPDKISEGTAVTTHYFGKSSGVWYFHVRARDKAGNWGAAAHYTVHIDTIVPAAPTVSSSTHPNQTLWYSNNSPAFSWSASDGISGIGGYSCTLDQNALASPARVNQGITATASYTGKTDGIWYFHVRAVDKAGNWGAAKTYMVKIDATAPAAPAVNSSTHPNQSLWYNNCNPILNWKVPYDTSGIVGYSYILNQIPDTIPAKVSKGAALIVQYVGILNGTWYFHIRAVDKAGNWGTAAHYTVHIDTVAPAISVVSSLTHPNQTLWYSNNSPIFSWHTSDTGSGVAGFSYILDHNALTLPACANQGITATANYSDKADGIWYFHVRAADNAGIWGAAKHYKVQIDTVAPNAPAVSASTALVSGIKVTTFKWTDTDTPSGIAGYYYTLDAPPGTPANLGAAVSKSYSNLPVGTHHFYIQAVDKAGSWGTVTTFMYTVN